MFLWRIALHDIVFKAIVPETFHDGRESSRKKAIRSL